MHWILRVKQILVNYPEGVQSTGAETCQPAVTSRVLIFVNISDAFGLFMEHYRAIYRPIKGHKDKTRTVLELPQEWTLTN